MSADDIKLPEPALYVGTRLFPYEQHMFSTPGLRERLGYDSATADYYTAEQLRAAVLADRARRTPSPQGDAEDDWTEFGKRFAIDLNNTLAAAEMVHKGAGEGPYEALLIGIELLAQHARLAMRRRGDA